MSLNATMLFGAPQQEIASTLGQHFAQCIKASVVVGFATVEGLRSIAPAIVGQPKKLETFVLGASTFRGFETLDELLGHGVPHTNVMVHLGHSRPMGKGFQKYHPMLHSKVYLFDMPNGRSVAFVGSHNLTGYALFGQNGEASVMLEGESRDPEFSKIRQHIAEARQQSIQYRPEMKSALTWWASQFVNGLWGKLNDKPDDSENKQTIVILASEAAGRGPKKGDVIYFEIPSALGEISSLRAEVHIYIFDRLPATPGEALNSLNGARSSLWCKTLGLERKKGGVELQADWQIKGVRPPVLSQAPKPFRPTLSQDMQQVRVEAWNSVFKRYEYRFEVDGAQWEPVYERESNLRAAAEHGDLLRSLSLRPGEDGEWILVRDLKGAGSGKSERYLAARREMSPDSESYILFSSRRRDLSKRVNEEDAEYE